MFYFDIEIVKSNKGKMCNLCPTNLTKGTKHFIMFHWDRTTMKYPNKKNVCMECAKRLTHKEFTDYLRDLYNELVSTRKLMEGVT